MIFEEFYVLLHDFIRFTIMKLVFASNNKHKLGEVRLILPREIDIISLQEIGFSQDINETGETLEENSELKAQTIWEWLETNRLLGDIDGVFADDTGLEITALGGVPGVRTARWASEIADDTANRTKALEELAGVQDRSAQFRTVITLITHGKKIQVEGVVRGKISDQEEGEGGFGYDPVFIPEGYKNTFATLPIETKNSISHRGKALEHLREVLGHNSI